LSGALPASLMNLDLDWFSFQATNLCEPPDAAFQAWLAAIPHLQRTGVLCATATPTTTRTPTATRTTSPTPTTTPALAEIARDSGTADGYYPAYKSGDGVGIVLEAPAEMYPIRPVAVRAMFFPVGVSGSVTVKPHIYAVSGGVPGSLLAEGTAQIVTVFYPDWASVDISTAGLVLNSPQPVLVVIRYEGGTANNTASVMLDDAANIPIGANFYDVGMGWVEHYDHWGDSENTGYNMIRLMAQTNAD